MMDTSERARNLRAERKDTDHAHTRDRKSRKWKDKNTTRTKETREKSPYTTFNTALIGCSVELVHSTGMAHVITHMQAGILGGNWNLELLSFPNISV